MLFKDFSVFGQADKTNAKAEIKIYKPSSGSQNFYGEIKVSGNDRFNKNDLIENLYIYGKISTPIITTTSTTLSTITLNLSTDKSEYKVGESAKFYIDVSGLTPLPDSLNVIFYNTVYPEGRGGCANGCASIITRSNNNIYETYTNVFTNEDVGSWEAYVMYNNFKSNKVSYKVISEKSEEKLEVVPKSVIIQTGGEVLFNAYYIKPGGLLEDVTFKSSWSVEPSNAGDIFSTEKGVKFKDSVLTGVTSVKIIARYTPPGKTTPLTDTATVTVEPILIPSPSFPTSTFVGSPSTTTLPEIPPILPSPSPQPSIIYDAKVDYINLKSFSCYNNRPSSEFLNEYLNINPNYPYKPSTSSIGEYLSVVECFETQKNRPVKIEVKGSCTGNKCPKNLRLEIEILNSEGKIIDSFSSSDLKFESTYTFNQATNYTVKACIEGIDANDKDPSNDCQSKEIKVYDYYCILGFCAQTQQQDDSSSIYGKILKVFSNTDAPCRFWKNQICRARFGF